MKTDLQTLEDTFKLGYEAFEPSRIEEKEIRDFYHNRQYTTQELNVLNKRGQPHETFNVIKLFGRLLIGYYSTVVNTVNVAPAQQSDELTAMLLHDVVQYTFKDNKFETEGDKVKQDGILSGLMCVYENVVDTGKKDKFGRPIRRVEITHVPSYEIVLDPMSRKEDYSDARFIHRFKWVSEEYLTDFIKQNRKQPKKIIDKLHAYENHLQQEDTDFDAYNNLDRFSGFYKQFDNYLLVHSIVKDDKGKTWSIFWIDDVEISRKEVTYRDVQFPYRVQKVHDSDQTEYYGIFREVKQSQKSINQALVKIQLMVNSQKAFVEEGGVDKLDDFIDAFNRVNAVIPVKKLSKIKVESLSREVMDQYTIIDKAFDRIQRVLGINDAFLGNAYASDSGRKVKLQQNATTLALRYLTVKIEQLYRSIGWDIVNLVKQFYTANEALAITDESVGRRWIELNQPMQIFTGQFNDIGEPIMEPVLEEVIDPETLEPMLDDEGNYIMAPVPVEETEIAFSEVDLDIDSTAYNDEDEKNQLMIETIIQGPIGQAMLNVNPAGYFKVAAKNIQNVRTKNSHEIADIVAQTAEMLNPQAMQQQQLPEGSKSSELKLPQNTNEGV